MSKFATKAAANMFCQARYEAAKSNERLSSREGAAEEIGIDRTRLARIELGSTIPYQEEVLLMLLYPMGLQMYGSAKTKLSFQKARKAHREWKQMKSILRLQWTL